VKLTELHNGANNLAVVTTRNSIHNIYDIASLKFYCSRILGIV